MNPWPFIIGAYSVTILGAAALAFESWMKMRRAEADAENLRK